MRVYLHLGNDVVVKTEEIIGIFDLDNTTLSRHTRNYLALREKKREVINVSYELPKTFIVCSNKKSKKKIIYISQISSQTLLKRIGYSENFNLKE